MKHSFHVKRREETDMAIADFPNFIDFIKTAKFNCGYELILLYAAIKLKNEEGGFDREKLVDFFIDFYRIREKNRLALESYCDPLQNGDRVKTIRLINRNPISYLLNVGIFKTFERFDSNIFQIIFNNEDQILLTIKERIKQHFSKTLGDSNESTEAVLLKWEKGINESIRVGALQKFAACYDKINIEVLLKFLYHSYSLRTFDKLMEDFLINPREFKDYFSSKIKYQSKFFSTEKKDAPAPPVERKQKLKKYSAQRIKDLTNIFHKMREEPIEDEPLPENSKKKKKK